MRLMERGGIRGDFMGLFGGGQLTATTNKQHIHTYPRPIYTTHYYLPLVEANCFVFGVIWVWGLGRRIYRSRLLLDIFILFIHFHLSSLPTGHKLSLPYHAPYNYLPGIDMDITPRTHLLTILYAEFLNSLIFATLTHLIT